MVDGACAFVREFPRELVFRAALGVLSIPGDNTRAFTPHGVAAFAAIEVRHAPEGRYSEAAVARANALRDALAPGGSAIFSGMELAEADLFRPALRDGGFVVAEEIVDEGWWAVRASRR